MSSRAKTRHAQCRRALLGEVVPTVQAGDLWIMDRNFCVRAFLARASRPAPAHSCAATTKACR